MWLSVAVEAEAERAEALSEALMEQGALSVSIEDADAGTAQCDRRNAGADHPCCFNIHFGSPRMS